MSKTEWTDYQWQLIAEQPQPPLMHMALDEALLDQVAAGIRPPTLRIWEWGASAIIIGRFQSLRNEVDLANTERYGIEVVRRITGGGAMFVEPGNTITYSIYAPETLVAGLGTVNSYAYLDQWVLDALGDLGIKAWYQPINDITSEGGKIGGAAQIRRRGAVLHHVTMSYDIDAEKMVEVLRIGREKMSDKGTKSAAKRVDPLRRQTGLSRAEIVQHLINSFRQRYGLQDSAPTEEELAKAQQLIDTKFGTAEWISILP